MKSLLTLMSFAVLTLGTLTQAHACPCVDQETLTDNQRYHEAGLQVDQAVIARVHTASLVTLINTSITLHQAKITELEAMSVNAGIPYRPNGISQAFTDRGTAELTKLQGLSGSALEDEYITFHANELQLLLTAFDTYFIPQVTTPTMKTWTPTERTLVSQNYNQAIQLQAVLMPQ